MVIKKLTTYINDIADRVSSTLTLVIGFVFCAISGVIISQVIIHLDKSSTMMIIIGILAAAFSLYVGHTFNGNGLTRKGKGE